MDPLSVTASIIAILDLSTKILSYLNDVKHATRERDRCALEAASLYGLLFSLRGRVEEGNADDPWYTAVRALIIHNGPLDQFRHDLELLQEKMTDGGRLKKALLWKFDKAEITGILGRMERLKTLIGTALQMDHFKLSQAIKQETRNISDDTTSIKNDTGLIRSHLPILDSIRQDQNKQICDQADIKEREQLDQLLAWLSPTDYPAQLAGVLKRRQKGTCQWLLDSDELKKWLAEPKQTLFCLGIPGAGKTIAAASIIDSVIHSQQLQDSTIGVAYVFCSYKVRSEQSSANLLAAILKQLVQSKPSNAAPVKHLRKSQADQHRAPSTEEVLDTLSSVLKDYSTTYIVVDAIDECLDTVRFSFINKLRTLQDKHDLRVLITSRFSSDIFDTFHDALSLEVRADPEDVKLYVASQIDRLPRCIQRDPELTQLVHERIAAATDGMFLLARLYLDSLLDKRTKGKVQSTLNALRTGSEALRKAYDDAIIRIQSQMPEDAALAQRVLSWITHARRPLTTVELINALAVKSATPSLDLDDLEDIEVIVSVCTGLVTIDEESDVIRLVHYTTQEYLESIHKDWSPNVQLEMASACLTYLTFKDFQDGACKKRADWVIRRAKNAFLEYAARYWGEHASSVQPEIYKTARSVLLHSGLVSSAAQAFYRSNKNELLYLGDGKGTTATHLCARFGLFHLLERILHESTEDPTSMVQVQDSNGDTPLLFATQYNHSSTAKLLIESGANVNERRNSGSLTPLHIASKRGFLDICKLLLDNGADIEATDWASQTPLHLATERGFLDICKLLLDNGADANGRLTDPAFSSHSPTPLHIATERGFVDICKLLLNNGAEIEATNDFLRCTPLHLASKRGFVDICKLLLNNGADIKVSNLWSQTPLYLASGSGQEATVKLLLDHNADTAAQSRGDFDYERTALHQASKSGNARVVEMLLAKGVAVSPVDGEGQTPLHLASRRGHLDVMRSLLKYNADVSASWIPGNAFGNLRSTPANAALVRGHIDALAILLKYLPNINTSPDANYGTLLHSIAFRGHTDILKMVVEEYNANLRLQDHHHRTLLHMAALGGHLDTLLYLIGEGLDPMHKDDLGKDILCYAALGGNSRMVKYVLEEKFASSSSAGHWNAIHWACRNGIRPCRYRPRSMSDTKRARGLQQTKVLVQLILAGIDCETITVDVLPGQWSPASIGSFHDGSFHDDRWPDDDSVSIHSSNDAGWADDDSVSLVASDDDGWSDDDSDSIHSSNDDGRSDDDSDSTHSLKDGPWLEDVSNSLKLKLGADNGLRMKKNGKCYGCYSTICGPRFSCPSSACPPFQYCFMCSPAAEELHKGHGWHSVDPPEPMICYSSEADVTANDSEYISSEGDEHSSSEADDTGDDDGWVSQAESNEDPVFSNEDPVFSNEDPVFSNEDPVF